MDDVTANLACNTTTIIFTAITGILAPILTIIAELIASIFIIVFTSAIILSFEPIPHFPPVVVIDETLLPGEPSVESVPKDPPLVYNHMEPLQIRDIAVENPPLPTTLKIIATLPPCIPSRRFSRSDKLKIYEECKANLPKGQHCTACRYNAFICDKCFDEWLFNMKPQ